MEQSAIILTHHLDSLFLLSFSAFMGTHFPHLALPQHHYDRHIPERAVVFAESYLPIPEFNAYARDLADPNLHNTVFVLTEGLTNSSDDLIRVGSPSSLGMGCLSGVEGVVYSFNDAFSAFTQRQDGPAQNVLGLYCGVRGGAD